MEQTALIEVNVTEVIVLRNFITNNEYMLVATDQPALGGGYVTLVIPYEESLIGHTGTTRFLRTPYINNGVFSGFNHRLVSVEPKKATK